MSKKNIIGSVLFLALVAAGIYIYSEWNRRPEDLKEVQADEAIAAHMLLQEFATDTSAASEKYIDKVLRVTGTVKSYDTSGVINLGMPDDISSIQCSMDPRTKVNYALLEPGTKVTLKGVCNGYQADPLLGTDVKMNYCVLVNK